MEKRTEIHHLKKGEPVHLTSNGSVPLDLTMAALLSNPDTPQEGMAL